MVRVSAALSAAWSMASRAGLIGVAPAASMASVSMNERYSACDLAAGQSSSSRMSRIWLSASSASLSKEP